MAGYKTLIAGAVAAAVAAGSAFAETTIRIQSVISAKADEVTMLQAFADDVTALTNGSLKFEILPAGAVVGVRETLDAVDKGLIEGGFAWTHYWGGKHPAANAVRRSDCWRWRWPRQHRVPVSWFQYARRQRAV